jgi:16S rRNA (uracil1498-N3)-methyltransferase
MPRIYLPISRILDNRISITNEKAHYLTSVLRCGKGDELIIFDGKGDCFRTTILKADRREIITEVIEKFQCNAESNINITLVQGLLKGEKMDVVIQKTTELGVKEIIPVVTERSQLRETRKVARWRKIAEEASRQSGRSIIPVIHNPIKFFDILNLLRPSNKVKSLLFYEEGGMKLSEAVSSFVPRPLSLFVFVGPEGGFTKEEVFLAKEKGLLVTSLGERILRAETAAISAVALVQFLLGDMG